VVGVLLGVLQLWLVRRNFLQHFDRGTKITWGELEQLKEPLRTIAVEGWMLGVVGISLIVAGIVCETVAGA
jgi:hypothetical protein